MQMEPIVSRTSRRVDWKLTRAPVFGLVVEAFCSSELTRSDAVRSLSINMDSDATHSGAAGHCGEGIVGVEMHCPY
jgi:hypothetical protein